MNINIANRTIVCNDNLLVLRGMNSECVDLIYLDPPFNKKKEFSAPIGSSAEGASFRDIFTLADIKEEWVQEIREDWFAIHRLLEAVRDMEGRTSYNFCYLAYMAIRLIECHRVLQASGSLYLHCDPTMSHYLKLLLDTIFGERQFRNEIIWCYSRPSAPNQRQLSRVHNTIFWYTKSDSWYFDPESIRQPYAASSRAREGYSAAASKVAEGTVELKQAGKFPESWIYIPPIKGNATEYVGYPTQKPLALLERIIKSTSKAGDTVLDPFCGCATTCVAAEKLGRNWIGIDVSVRAYELVKQRIVKEALRPDVLFEVDTAVHYTTTAPTRDDNDDVERLHKYVYVISHPQYPGEYKVGIAGNVKRRLNSYQTSDPNRAYALEYSFRTLHFRALEKHIHQQFDSRHEWVKGELKDIIAEIGSYEPPTQ